MATALGYLCKIIGLKQISYSLCIHNLSYKISEVMSVTLGKGQFYLDCNPKCCDLWLLTAAVLKHP